MRIDLPDADLTLATDFDCGQPTRAVLDQLIAETAWRQDSLRLYGRVHPQPRLTAWVGDAGATYRYSGLRLAPLPWTVLLADLRRRVEVAAGARFNSVLLNFYRDGRDSMGLHSDDEPELGEHPVIASLSLGAPRSLVLRRKTRDAPPPVRLPLPDGSLLIMRGTTQRFWKHGIEKRRSVFSPRLNLTFRLIHSPNSVPRDVTAQAPNAVIARPLGRGDPGPRAP